MKMMSYCDVTNSLYPVAMTTIRLYSIVEFVWGHKIKQSPLASPYLCTLMMLQKGWNVLWTSICIALSEIWEG